MAIIGSDGFRVAKLLYDVDLDDVGDGQRSEIVNLDGFYLSEKVVRGCQDIFVSSNYDFLEGSYNAGIQGHGWLQMSGSK